MSLTPFTVRAPATTANLGPGFDSFGLALDLWNEVDFSFDCERSVVTVEGYSLIDNPSPENNLILKSFALLCQEVGREVPKAFRLHCRNRVPLGSGLGSSAAAIACGLVAANHALNLGFDPSQLIDLGTRMEGHPDNIAAALLGGLTIGAQDHENEATLIASYPVESWHIAVVKPDIVIMTEDARRALPKKVDMADAVFNIQRIPFLLTALCGGDEATLNFAMRDRIHQQYRFPLIPGGQEICDAAVAAGAAAAVISGAGPSLIAFSMKPVEPILDAMRETCSAMGLDSEVYALKVSSIGAGVIAS